MRHRGVYGHAALAADHVADPLDFLGDVVPTFDELVERAGNLAGQIRPAVGRNPHIELAGICCAQTLEQLLEVLLELERVGVRLDRSRRVFDFRLRPPLREAAARCLRAPLLRTLSMT